MTAPIQPLSIAHARADGGRVLVLRGDVAVDNAPDMIAAFTARPAARRRSRST